MVQRQRSSDRETGEKREKGTCNLAPESGTSVLYLYLLLKYKKDESNEAHRHKTNGDKRDP
jgi:hypothetical protein